MSIQYCDLPPSNGKAYVIPQLEGEMLSIPGSKGVFRILTSAIQTDDAMSVFTTGAVLADAPGFHHHNEAHDVFLVTKGYMKLWNGDRCRILGPGDFASIPPVSKPLSALSPPKRPKQAAVPLCGPARHEQPPFRLIPF